MARNVTPFALIERLPPRLEFLNRHWGALRRGQADMPFADDIDLTKIETIAGDVFILRVSENPTRFRFDILRLPGWPGASDLANRFLDEITPAAPFDLARAQADATVETRAPSFYEHRSEGQVRSYARLMLPFWGEGQVKLILGAID